MKLDKRLSSYPILINDDDDYVDSSFEISLIQKVEFNKLIVNVSFQLNNEGLLELIKEGKAKYIIHVDCPMLSFRKVFSTDKKDLEFSINLNDVTESVEISSMIVATMDIPHYYNKKFNWFYGTDGVDISKGNYLAIGPMYLVNINRSNIGYKKLSDVIVIQKDDRNSDQMSVSLDNDIITILVNEKIKNQYYAYGQQYLYNIISMVMVPSMVYVLTSMKNNPDGLCSYRWYSVVEQVLLDNNISVTQLNEEDSTGKYSIFEVAQKIFMSPLEKGMLELSNVRLGDE